MSKTTYNVPSPVVDDKENEALIKLTERYEKLLQPGPVRKAGTKALGKIPDSVKDIAKKAKDGLTEKELFIKSMDILAKSFKMLEQNAAKLTVSEKYIVESINKLVPYNIITELKEICLARSYDVAKLVSKYKNLDLSIAVAEGAATGAPGFAGLPFNLVLSTFIFYRAVQSVAMFYGYDVKNDPAELEIASEVFSNAMSPSSSGSGELSSTIAKIMLFTETTTIRQTAKKTWTEMATKDGVTLLITQMRALAYKSAKDALVKAEKEGLEKSAFKSVYEQIGKRLSKETVKKSMPFVGAFIGAGIDYYQMKKILDYADIFYQKRYILEKAYRINDLLGKPTTVIEIDDVEETIDNK